MKVLVSNQIEFALDELSDIARRSLERELTLKNPAYEEAVKRSRRPYGIPEQIHLYKYKDGKMILNRGSIQTLRKYAKDVQILDKRLTLTPVSFDLQIELRPYQKIPVQKLVQATQGGLASPCGSGKTNMALAAIAQIKQPALVLVHTKELADQFRSRAVQVLGLSEDGIGYIGDGKYTVGERLTVGLVQTLSRRDLSDFVERFGCLVIDEAHRMPGKQFFEVVNQFPAKYRIWLSATPDRADGLTPMLTAAGGPIVHQIDQSEVPTLKPSVVIVETAFNSFESEYVRVLDALTKDNKRNRLIVETIMECAKGHYSLILSERVEHLEILYELLSETMPELRIEILTGRMSKKARTDVMQRALNKEIDILLSTMLAREGLDLPHLDRLFLVAPKKAQGALQQEVGRIQRPAVDKTDAVVFDFWDSRCGIIKNQLWARRELYQKLGASIVMPQVRKRMVQ